MTRKHPVNLYVELAKAFPLLTNVELAERIGVSEAAVRRNLRLGGFDRNPKEYLPIFSTPELDKPIEVIGKIGLAADWHLPLTDYEYANRMISHFLDLGITTLGIPGDLFNLDALSRYENKQETADLEREVYEGQMVVDRLLDNFERIIISRGNHDIRIARTLGFKLQFKQAISLLFGDINPDKRARLEISNLDHFWVRPFEGALDYESWLITHPENYSTLPLSVARELAGKYGSNVCTAHSHHAALGYAKNGHHVVCELGGLHDRRATQYLQNTSKFANWVSGYAWIDDENKIHMDTPNWGVG